MERLASRMRRRWQPVTHRYPTALNRLRRFCAPGAPAAARAALAETHMPAGTAAAVAETARAFRALRSLGGEALELGNFVEQLALDVLGDARTAGSLLTWCFDDTPSEQ